MQQRPGLLSKVDPFVIRVSASPSDAEVEPLLARRQELLQKLGGGTAVGGVLEKPVLLPAPRRKTQWDYLLEEMAWMATDFHEERKWKKAAGGLMSRAAASEARRRVARERGVGEETSRICHRLSTGVMTFWRGVSSQIRYFNDSQAMLQQEQQAVLAKEAAAAAKEEGGGEEEDEEEDEEEEEDEDEDEMDTEEAEAKKAEKAAARAARKAAKAAAAAAAKRPEMTDAEVLRLRELVKQCVNGAQEVAKAEHAKIKAAASSSPGSISQERQPPGDAPPLLPHQLAAFRWLQQLGERKHGAILADAPGMGKTVVVIRVMADLANTLKQRSAGGGGGVASASPPSPQLLVVPAFSIVRWKAEMSVHGKGLSVMLLEEWGPATRSSKVSAAAKRQGVDVVLCSSAALGSPDAMRLPDHAWSNFVVDLREPSPFVVETAAAGAAAGGGGGLAGSSSSASVVSSMKEKKGTANVHGDSNSHHKKDEEEDEEEEGEEGSTATGDKMNGDEDDEDEDEEEEGSILPPLTEWQRVAKLSALITGKAERCILLTNEGVSKERKHLQQSAAWLSLILPHIFSSAADVLTWAPKAAASLANATAAAKAALAASSGTNAPPPPRPPPPPTPEYVGRIVRGFQMQRGRAQADEGERQGATEVVVIKCPMPALQEKEYQRIQGAASAAGPPRKGAGKAGEAATRMLAGRFACLHADLAFWYRGASGNEQPLVSKYLPVGALSLAVAGEEAAGATCSEDTRSSKTVSAASAASSLTGTGAGDKGGGEGGEGGVLSAWDDVGLFSQHNSLLNCTEKSAKFIGLLKLLRQFDGQGKKIVLLASLPQALALIHTYLTAADVPHYYCGPVPPPPSSFSSISSFSSSTPSWLQTQLTIARFNLSTTTLQATTRVLVAPTAACLDRGGLIPSSADVAIVLDDEWNMEGRTALTGLLERMSMRSKALKVFRLVTEGTMEEDLWPTTLPAMAPASAAVTAATTAATTTTTTTTGAAAALKFDPLALMQGIPLSQAQVGMEEGVEKQLRARERRLLLSHAAATAALPVAGGRKKRKKHGPAADGDEESMAMGRSGELCRECFTGQSLGAYGKMFLHRIAAVTEGEKGGAAPRGPSPTEGLSLILMEETGSFAASDAVVHDAMRALVMEVPAGVTNAQALLEHSTAMRALGIEMDMSIAAPPIPPSDPSLTELIEFPSWVDDPVSINLGLLIKYVSLAETITSQQRRKKLQDARRAMPQHHRPGEGRGEVPLGPDGRPLVSPGGMRAPGHGRPRIEMPTDWSSEEDQELLWAYDTYGRNPLVIPFVLNKKTPPYVKKRSSKQCLDRIDALLNQGIHQAGLRLPRPSYALPLFRGRVLSLRSPLFDTPWTPPIAPTFRKSPRQQQQQATVMETPPPTIVLPGPDHDAQLRLSRSFLELSRIQTRLRQSTSLPEGCNKLPPSTTPITTPETVPLNPPHPALNILEQQKKAAATAATAAQAAAAATAAPRPSGVPGQSLPPPPPPPPPQLPPPVGAGGVVGAPPPPPPSTLVNVSSVNQSLAPILGLSALGAGSGFGLGGGRGGGAGRNGGERGDEGSEEKGGYGVSAATAAAADGGGRRRDGRGRRRNGRTEDEGEADGWGADTRAAGTTAAAAAAASSVWSDG